MNPEPEDVKPGGHNGTGKYGWCLDGHHEKCPRTAVPNRPCTCTCHTEQPPPGVCSWCGHPECGDCRPTEGETP